MQELMNRFLTLDITSLAVMPLVFLLGSISSIGSCSSLMFISVIAGYSGSRNQSENRKSTILNSISFLLGTMVVLIAVGVSSGVAGLAIKFYSQIYMRLISGSILMVIGLISLRWVPLKIFNIQIKPRAIPHTLGKAFLFGLVIGGLMSVCSLSCNPFIPLLFGLTFTYTTTLWGFALLIVFALGYALPVAAVLIGFNLGFDAVSKFAIRVQPVIQKISGIALLVLGALFIITS